MKAKQAYASRIELQYTCISITSQKWNKLMNGAKRASGVKIRQMIKLQLPELYKEMGLQFPNPYEANCMRTDTHLIYVHSAIEYFFRIS